MQSSYFVLKIVTQSMFYLQKNGMHSTEVPSLLIVSWLAVFRIWKLHECSFFSELRQLPDQIQ